MKPTEVPTFERHVGLGELDAASELALRLVGRFPHSPQPWELLAWADFRQGDLAGCLASLEEATLLGPLSQRSRILVALVHAKSGRTDLARDLLALASEDEPDLDCEDEFLAAAAHAAVGRYDLALRACRRAAEGDPNCAEAYHLASRYGAACGLPDRTVESLARRAVRLAPESATYRLALAGLLVEADRETEAGRLVSNFAPAEIRDVGCLHCVELLADLYETAHDWRRVVVCRERLLQLEASARRASED